ncbi:hypothetical protein C5B96_05410 [Subtercola sp. Z020]|nr:hypothetical protein C5B96_05410 [Subtercola sp. Z020]
MNAMEVLPVIDGSPLTALVTAFEVGRGWDPAGGYGGLFPTVFGLGSAAAYWLGEHPAGDRVFALGCECGEMACWPLAIEVATSSDTVGWQKFRQPYRSDRDYSAFGPFIFDRTQYEAAVASIAPLFERLP